MSAVPMVEGKKRVFSGIQPTGELHLGNLVGALRNWAQMQQDYETYYCVVDLHAMTVPYDPVAFGTARLETAKLVMASGIDPGRSVFYFQSQVPQHAELAWVLSTITGIGQLNRMTQYKEKADRTGQNLGLLSYPVLMAADILIHKVHAVPVGDDQRQHLELTRDLVERFNHRFGEVFPVPDRITPEVGARVMSLQDPTSKMSKSDPDVRSRLLLTDSADQIRRKVRAAVTDSGRTVDYDWETKPGISNLLELFSVASGRSAEDLASEYRDQGYGRFKGAVAEALCEYMAPVRERYEGMEDAEVSRLMSEGAAEARRRAAVSMATVWEAVGLST
ncbi:MAG: tryptophan--tRNA ligase [bacterium]|nr:tryptophan--tRNA ligase [bacterium]